MIDYYGYESPCLKCCFKDRCSMFLEYGMDCSICEYFKELPECPECEDSEEYLDYLLETGSLSYDKEWEEFQRYIEELS